MIDEEEWGYLNDWEPDQLRKKKQRFVCVAVTSDMPVLFNTLRYVTYLSCPPETNSTG